MNFDASSVWRTLCDIRAAGPVVHNITNYVVMNSTANALLAVGASPVMAHALEEVEDMVAIAGALVLNIGTLSPRWIEAMHRAGRRARQRGIPVVLDPVGAGATPLRTETAKSLLDEVAPAVLRGNASEILALQGQGQTKGVDSTAASTRALEAARAISGRSGCVVCVSGATDFVLSGEEMWEIDNGHPLMTRVTGLGCTASALCGAFVAVQPAFGPAVAQAMVVMGIAGEMAVGKASGPGSLQIQFLDALYAMAEDDIRRRFRGRG